MNKDWKDRALNILKTYYLSFSGTQWHSFNTETDSELLKVKICYAIFGPPTSADASTIEEAYSDKQKSSAQEIIRQILKVKRDGLSSEISIGFVFVVCHEDGKENEFVQPVFSVLAGTKFGCDKKKFVDMQGRIYDDWNDWKRNNCLPKVEIAYPANGYFTCKDGSYVFDSERDPVIEFGKSPQCSAWSTTKSVGDVVTGVTSFGCAAIGIASLFTPLAPVVLTASAVAGGVSASYGAVRGVGALVDKGTHGQSLKDLESLTLWFSIAATPLHFASSAETGVLARGAVQEGRIFSQGMRTFASVLLCTTFGLDTALISFSFANLVKKYQDDQLTSLDLVQFSMSAFFFTNTLIQPKTAYGVIKKAQTAQFGRISKSMTDKTVKETFDKFLKTNKVDGSIQDRSKIVQAVNRMKDPNKFFRKAAADPSVKSIEIGGRKGTTNLLGDLSENRQHDSTIQFETDKFARFTLASNPLEQDFVLSVLNYYGKNPSKVTISGKNIFINLNDVQKRKVCKILRKTARNESKLIDVACNIATRLDFKTIEEYLSIVKIVANAVQVLQLKEFLKSEIEFESTPIVPSYLTGTAMQEYDMVDLKMLKISTASIDCVDDTQTSIKTILPHNFVENFYSADIFEIVKSEALSLGLYQDIVAVIGSARSGKTSLMKTILQNKKLPVKFDYIFFLQCNCIDFSVKIKTNLLQFLATTLPYHWVSNKQTCVNVLKKLDNCDNVLIIIDGYERVYQNNQLVTSLEEEATAQSFIESILSRNLLIKAKVIMTACSYSFCNLNRRFRNYPIFELLGLTIDTQKKIYSKICGENALKVMNMVRFYPSLHTFCKDFENCAAVAYVVNKFLQQPIHISGPPAFFTITQVSIAAWALLNRSKNLKLDKEFLKQLAAFAWKQVNGGIRHFHEKDLPCGCTLDPVAVLLRDEISLENDLKCVRKLRNLWIEILAALHCIFFMDIDEFQDFLEQVFQGTPPNLVFQIVVIHACGIREKGTRRYLKKLLPVCQFPTSKLAQLEDKIRKLIEKTKDNFSMSIFLCSLTHSMLDQPSASDCAKQLDPDVEIVDNDIDPILYVGLRFALHCMENNYGSSTKQERCSIRASLAILNSNSDDFVQKLKEDLANVNLIAENEGLVLENAYDAVYHYRKHGEKFFKIINLPKTGYRSITKKDLTAGHFHKISKSIDIGGRKGKTVLFGDSMGNKQRVSTIQYQYPVAQPIQAGRSNQLQKQVNKTIKKCFGKNPSEIELNGKKIFDNLDDLLKKDVSRKLGGTAKNDPVIVQTALTIAEKMKCTTVEEYLSMVEIIASEVEGKSPHARKIVLTNLNQNSALFIQTLQSDLVTAETIARRGDLTFIDPYKAVYHYRKHGEEFPRFISKYGNTVEVYLGPVKNHVIKPSNLCERMELPDGSLKCTYITTNDELGVVISKPGKGKTISTIFKNPGQSKLYYRIAYDTVPEVAKLIATNLGLPAYHVVVTVNGEKKPIEECNSLSEVDHEIIANLLMSFNDTL